MSMPKMKAYATFDDYLADQPAKNAKIIRALRTLMKRTAPKLEEAVKWGNGCWLKGKVPVTYVYSDKTYVQFGFLLGSQLDDPKKILEGKAAHVRHIKVHSTADIDGPVFAKYVRQAIKLTPDSFAKLPKKG
jgi:hypothetical protein